MLPPQMGGPSLALVPLNSKSKTTGCMGPMAFTASSMARASTAPPPIVPWMAPAESIIAFAPALRGVDPASFRTVARTTAAPLSMQPTTA